MQMMQPSDGQKRQNFLIGGHGEERREKKEGHHGWLIGQKRQNLFYGEETQQWQ